MRARMCTPSIVISIVLIGVGTLFLLDNIGLIRIWNVWRFWPAALIVAGVSRLMDRRGPADWLWSIFLILCGGLWLGNNLHWLYFGFGTIWPLTLITLGVMGLTKTLESQGFSRYRTREAGVNYVREFVVFSGTKKKLETAGFEGGEIVCIFGGVELNLRKCGIENPEHKAARSMWRSRSEESSSEFRKAGA